MTNNMFAIITVGIPGCGKSTWATQHAETHNARVIELDMARAAINGDASVQANIQDVVALRDNWIRESAEAGQSIIVADTNLDAGFRVKLQNDLKALGYPVSLRVFYTPHAVSKTRNEARERVVPDHAMERMIQQFDEQFGIAVSEYPVPKGYQLISDCVLDMLENVNNALEAELRSKIRSLQSEISALNAAEPYKRNNA